MVHGWITPAGGVTSPNTWGVHTTVTNSTRCWRFYALNQQVRLATAGLYQSKPKGRGKVGFWWLKSMTQEFVEKGINDMSLKKHLIWFICKSIRCNSYVSVTSCVKLGWSTLEDCYWLGCHSQAYPRNHWWYCGWSEFCSISYCAFFISEASTRGTNHKLQKTMNTFSSHMLPEATSSRLSMLYGIFSIQFDLNLNKTPATVCEWSFF